MRIVILSSSLYSETACAMAVRMVEVAHAPVGALVLSTLNRATVLRKLGQWGAREVVRYAREKLLPRNGDANLSASNSYLEPLLKHESGTYRSLIEVAAVYGFPVAVCDDQNASDSIARLKEWAPDLIIFSGGNILRQQLLATPRLGVLNVHLGLLPEIRGMSSPEWSLLQGVPVGITIHYMDAGIDTGPILRRYEIPNAAQSRSLADLRNRLIAFGVEKTGGVVEEMIRGTISAAPQSEFEKDNQFFVMHEWLQARAAARLSDRAAPAAVPVQG
ncbi:MAG: formyltransferase family protein [Candidatus Sulfotelmatobacter sp.]